ncbi:MAG: polyketide cyclase [Taibaiella sp.]|nr:polyketide cyclase [Taibaiella sp.]
MDTNYSFVSVWKTYVPLAKVWEIINYSLHWPLWWKDFTVVKEIKEGDEYGVGSIRRYTVQSPAIYQLTFDLELTRRIDYQLLSGKATGELEGTGLWQFREKNGATYIECHWDVKTKKTWMNIFAFILRPAFIYNHRLIMKKGAGYLAGRSGAEVEVIN